MNLVHKACYRDIRLAEAFISKLDERMSKHENMTQEENLKANIEYFELRLWIAKSRYEIYKYR